MKVYEKKARKDYPRFNIKKGDQYFEWAFFRGPTIKSATRPRPSQLTQNSTLVTYNQALEALSDLQSRDEPLTPDDVKEALEDAATQMEEARDDADEKFNNMPEGLQSGGTGEQLGEWRESLDGFADALRAVDVPEEKEEGDTDEDFQEKLQEAINEGLGADPGIG